MWKNKIIDLVQKWFQQILNEIGFKKYKNCKMLEY